MTFNERLDKLNELVAKSNHIVFFGGAGVSTESGIPDFRSKDGLYNQHDVQFDQYSPEYLLSHSCLRDHPDVFFEFYRQKLDCRTIEPNVTHKVLADMEAAGKLACVVTQNIDGLHQKAGSKTVAELHGTTFENYCPKCGEPYPADYIFECGEAIPHCKHCDGIVRPRVTLYEENLPEADWNLASYHMHNADLIIVGGTSLSVYPAASLVVGRSCPIVLINRDETDMPRLKTAVTFNESLGEVFEKIKY